MGSEPPLRRRVGRPTMTAPWSRTSRAPLRRTACRSRGRAPVTGRRSSTCRRRRSATRRPSGRIPVLRRAFEGLARRLRLIQFDARGTGRSQRDVSDVSLEAMLRRHLVRGRCRRSRALRDPRHVQCRDPRDHRCGPLARRRQPSRPVRRGGPRLRPDERPRPRRPSSAWSSCDWDTFVESAAHAWLGWPDGGGGPPRRRTGSGRRPGAANAKATFQCREHRSTHGPAAARVRCPALVLHRVGGAAGQPRSTGLRRSPIVLPRGPASRSTPGDSA